jgi:hypothetical protein
MKMNENEDALTQRAQYIQDINNVMHIEIDKFSNMFHANLSTSSH